MPGLNKPLDGAGLAQVNTIVNERLGKKQDTLTGQPGQVVGFDGMGLAYAVRGWSNPNLLDNWYFPDPINQKGKTEYENAGYTIDRWRIDPGASIELLDDGVVFTPNPSNYNIFVQPIENYKELIGKQLTLSVLIKENTCSNCALWFYGGTTDDIVSTTLGDDKLYSVTMKLSSNAISLRCGLQGRSSSGSVKILGFKLELGSQQTLAHQDAGGNWVFNDPPPNKAQELAKCQRYQYVINTNGAFSIIPLNGFLGSGVSSPRASFTLPVPLRATPTIILSDSDWYIGGSTVFFHVTSIGFVVMDGANVRCAFNREGEPSDGPITFISNGGNVPASIVFDANL